MTKRRIEASASARGTTADPDLRCAPNRVVALDEIVVFELVSGVSSAWLASECPW